MYPPRRALGTTAGLVALLTLAVSPSAFAAVSDAQAASATPIAESSAWTGYVESPTTTTLTPTSVQSQSGQVTNPSGVTGGGSGRLTLTYPVGGTAPVVVLDYGKDVAGYPSFDVASVSSPNSIAAAFSETSYNMTPTGDGATTPLVFGDSGGATFATVPVATADTVGATQVQGGFRFERISLTVPGTVTLSGVHAAYSPPLEGASSYRGHFLSSSNLLNKVWYAGAYTINLDQIAPGTAGGVVPYDQPIVVDGAKRDRAVWSGDLAISDSTLHTVFGAEGDRYAKGSLTVFGDHPETSAAILAPSVGLASVPGPMPGFCPGPDTRPCLSFGALYSANYVENVYRYYQSTGDRAFVSKYWPQIQREIAWESQQLDPANGLFRTDTTDGFDWTANATSGDTAEGSVLHYDSLLSAAALATAVGQTSSAAQWRSAAAAEKTAINATLWDASLGAYDSATDKVGVLSEDANVWAVLYGVASMQQASTILTTLSTNLQTQFGLKYAVDAQYVSPYIQGFLVQAAFKAGSSTLAIDQIERTFGWMVANEPTSTMWERITLPNGTFGTAVDGVNGVFSLSGAHGWSTGATPALSQYVLGISPTTAGYATWQVRPQSGKLTWAQGQTPTKTGVLVSRWQRSANSSGFRLTVQAPSGTTGVVSVPTLGGARSIYEDGRLVWNGTRAVGGARASVGSGGYVDFASMTGSHTWAWGAVS